MPIFGDLADDDFAVRLSDYYAERIGPRAFSSIKDEAARSNPQQELFLGGPLIQRGIQGGRENKSKSGIQVKAELAVSDVARIGQRLASPTGLLHLATRFGQTKMQPMVNESVALRALNGFNPLTIPLQGGLGVLGIHAHPNAPKPAPSYLNDIQQQITPNRLVRLATELRTPLLQVTPGDSDVTLPTPITPLFTYPGGPNSLFGGGVTTLRRSRAGFAFDFGRVYYTTNSTYFKVGEQNLGQYIDEPDQTEVKSDSVPEMTNEDLSNPLAKYKSLAYGDLKKFDNKGAIQDFRDKTEIPEKDMTTGHHRPARTSYTEKSLHKRLALPRYGHGRNAKTGGDPITHTRGVHNDLVRVRITAGGVTFPFRAYINGAITDSTAFNWNEVSYVGNTANSYYYSNASRTWNLDLMVPCLTAAEQRNNVRKMDDLLQHLSPSIQDKRGVGSICAIQLGGYWEKRPTIIDKCDITIPDDSNWDIDHAKDGDWVDGSTSGRELPMYYTLALSGKFLSNFTRGSRYIDAVDHFTEEMHQRDQAAAREEERRSAEEAEDLDAEETGGTT